MKEQSKEKICPHFGKDRTKVAECEYCKHFVECGELYWKNKKTDYCFDGPDLYDSDAGNLES